jgi:hypothetical protein
MPLVWQDPEVLVTHRAIKVYRAYKNDDGNSVLGYHYSFGLSEDAPRFDVRDLPRKDDKEPHADVICKAIESGDLVVPDDAKPVCRHENIRIDSYKVNFADTAVELVRDIDTGRVTNFEFNRLDGELSEDTTQFCCEDCEEFFTWEQVKDL